MDMVVGMQFAAAVRRKPRHTSLPFGAPMALTPTPTVKEVQVSKPVHIRHVRGSTALRSTLSLLTTISVVIGHYLAGGRTSSKYRAMVVTISKRCAARAYTYHGTYPRKTGGAVCPREARSHGHEGQEPDQHLAPDR
jgi:hypothetical protein